MRTMIKRNMMLYFRNRSMVIYSFLSVIIIIILYAMFLGNTILENQGDYEKITELTKTWIMSGLIAVTTITTALISAQVMIIDRTKKTYQDFAVAPIKRVYLVGGYAVSTIFISFLMTVFTYVAAQIYLKLSGIPLVSVPDMLAMLGLIALSSISVSFTIFFVVCMIRSIQVYSVISSIISTIVGFLTGILIPMGNMPEFLRMIVIIFPFSHPALLYRNIMLDDLVKEVFQGAPESVVLKFEKDMGMVYCIGDWELKPYMSIIYLFVVAIVMFLLSIKQISKKQNTL